jgi:hypothetical protein
MIITLCGSAKFEKQFKQLNERLTLQGHAVFSLAVYPSDKAGNKNWYNDEEKDALDKAHKLKIYYSDAIVVINQEDYVGDSTTQEIRYAVKHKKRIMWVYSCWIPQEFRGIGYQLCYYKSCCNTTLQQPCALCYE